MTKLTREMIADGSLRTRLAMPAELSWSDQALGRSLNAMLEARPVGPLWVFAYGSLIWNPLIAFDLQATATLEGWHRSFCIRSISARGTPDRPGRVLALEAGGCTHGVAYRLSEARALTELPLLWTREMGSGVYLPKWCRLQLASGEDVHGIVFVANPDQPLYEPDASPGTVARLAAIASGIFGPNLEYITALDAALTERALTDPYIREILHATKQIEWR